MMNSAFGEIFMFLTNLAWKSRLTIPALVTTALLIMDVRLQIEINIQAGQTASTDLDDLENNDDDSEDEESSSDDDDDNEYDEYTTVSTDETDSQSEDENGNLYSMVLDDIDSDAGFDYEQNPANEIRIFLGLG